MPLSVPDEPPPAAAYRLPALLQDIRLLDLLELSGTTTEAARHVGLSQPTVSRRYRALAADFAFVPQRRRRVGCCYGTSTAMRLLRLGCRAHRLEAGVARFGADLFLQPLLAGCAELLPAPPRFRAADTWLELVRQGVLDGALVSGLELPAAAELDGHGVDRRELELLPLGALPLSLATAAPAGNHAKPPPVLVPHRGVARGLQRALQERGLRLITAGNTSHSPEQWRRQLEASALAMPLPALEPPGWWQTLQRLPLPHPLSLPVLLVLPAGWRGQGVLAELARLVAEQAGLVRNGAQGHAPGASES
ncbi:AsnC family protein [Cyanobium sp. NIES-981]|uniref:AsnC family protein n=1 Tax=Cyanobium sp. NIES-981 TaxID=1851505 RepID=UPI0007DCE743|nr:AsnC family protein [Cyanobium sp. NIES-981]SBO42700.1 conserved protein of unknown function [Cyanobium sp. NIES-981]